MFSVDPKIVKAVCACASSDPKRYALSAVKVECLGDGKARMTATDGKQLVEVTFRHFDPKDFPSEIDAVKSAKNGAKSALVPAAELARTVGKSKAAKRGSVPVLTMPVLVMGDAESTVIGTDLASTSADAIRNTEGSFPNTAKDAGGIWPEGEPIATVKLNPELLARLCAAALSLNPDARHPLMEISIYPDKVNKTLDSEGKESEFKSPQPVRVKARRIDGYNRAVGNVDLDAIVMPLQE